MPAIAEAAGFRKRFVIGERRAHAFVCIPERKASDSLHVDDGAADSFGARWAVSCEFSAWRRLPGDAESHGLGEHTLPVLTYHNIIEKTKNLVFLF